MRTILHISDVHFGMEDHTVVERLIEKAAELPIDVTVASGDLTQRARASQFKAAREMLDRLPKPQIVVPGNHDIPMYNFVDRFTSPLKKYKRYITEDLQPFYSDAELAIVGVNTSRSLTIKGGRINAEQIAEVRSKMSKLPDEHLKVVVTHHPFDVPDGGKERDIVGRAEEAVPLIAECGADVFLSGHLHISHIGNSARRYRLANGFSALIIQAGTAASTRERGEVNSFNVLEHEYPQLTVKRFECRVPSEGFKLATAELFGHSGRGWARA